MAVSQQTVKKWIALSMLAVVLSPGDWTTAQEATPKPALKRFLAGRDAALPPRREWQIDGVTREALVHVPDAARTTPAPVVFVFHGHGGTMRHSAVTFGYHRLWPEAIVVCMQGLNTPGILTDQQGKLPGWQNTPGDQNDRDLKFFDAVLASLKQDYKVDERRIYSTGHSNGGGFTYILWAKRGELFAAVAPSSVVAPKVMNDLQPKPVLHLAGEKDELVKYEWQKLTMERLRKINGCDDGKEWAKWCTEYASKADTPVVTYIHPGTHKYPEEASAVIVKFFKEHALPEAAKPK